MPFVKTIWKEKTSIVTSCHHAIIFCMLNTWNQCGKLGVRPQEPDFVAGLVLESAPLLHHSLSSIFYSHGIKCSLLAVYCHQVPKVAYRGISKKNCELGDMLFAHVHTNIFGNVSRNALLYQVKLSSKQPYRITNNEKDQLNLYKEWPDFIYDSSPPLSGNKRVVTPKDAHTGAQYMLIDDRPASHPQSGLLGLPNTYPIGSCMPDLFLHNHGHLAEEYFNFLLRRSGRPFADYATATAENNWSAVVWDLLNIGVRKAFNRKRSGYHKTSRYAGGPLDQYDGISFACTNSISVCSTVSNIIGEGDNINYLFHEENFNSSENSSLDNIYQDHGSGVSVVLLETKET